MKPKKELNTSEYDISEDAPEYFFDIFEPDAFMEMQEDMLWTDI